MATVNTLIELPPTFYLAAAIAAYPLVLALRNARMTVLMTLLMFAAASFVVLPEGQRLLSRSDVLPDRLQRLACFGGAVARGAPVVSGAVERTEACTFKGRGFPGQGDRSRARQMISKARSAVR